MLKNALLSFFRKIGKGDIHSLINLAGLSVGIATCLLIFLYIADELSYDRHHDDAPQIFRLLQHYPGSGKQAAVQPGVMYDFINEQVAGVQTMARLFPIRECPITVNDEPFTERGFVGADPAILDILSFKFLAGDPATALSAPHAIVLTASAAERYFGQENPMGQTVVFYNEFSFVVSGIIEDPPPQSHLRFSMLANIEGVGNLNPSSLTDWNNSGIFYYMKLNQDADPNHVSERIESLVWSANEHWKDGVGFRLQSLLSIRLFSGNVDWDNAIKSDIYIVLIFSATALLILFLACFNFVNLSTAAAVKRNMEVGVRKVLGANRGQLVRQFLLETFLFSVLAMGIALFLVEIFLPFLNNLSGKQLSQNLFSSIHFPLAVVGLLIVIPLLAGMYPSLIMSRFKAITAIKGGNPLSSVKGIRNKRYQLRMRQILLLLQFAVSIALIVGSLMIYQQMRFLSDRSPGYEAENLLAIKNPWDQQSSARALWLREKLLQHPEVQKVSLTHNVPTEMPNNYTNFSYETADGSQRLHGAVISCDTEFFETLGTPLLRGRDFLQDMPTDAQNATIINQTAAARIGVEDPIGMTLGGFYDNNPRQVIGVVEDIHFSSMHDAVIPMAFFINHESYPQNWFNLLVKYNPGSSSTVFNYLNELWLEEAPQWPMQYFFMDQQTRSLYQDDERVLHIVGSFAALAILLSSMGMIGLAFFAANTRTREIGIRKVLGASVREIVRLISGEFGAIALAANLIALPLAWYFINRWLENFAYRADTSWLIFVLPAVFVFLLAWTIVGLISYRAATLNPTVTLRSKG